MAEAMRPVSPSKCTAHLFRGRAIVRARVRARVRVRARARVRVRVSIRVRIRVRLGFELGPGQLQGAPLAEAA